MRGKEKRRENGGSSSVEVRKGEGGRDNVRREELRGRERKGVLIDERKASREWKGEDGRGRSGAEGEERDNVRRRELRGRGRGRGREGGGGGERGTSWE